MGQMHLFAGDQRHVQGHALIGVNHVHGAGVGIMIGHGQEIHALPPVIRRHNFRGLTAIGKGGMDMGVPQKGITAQQVGQHRVYRQTHFFLLPIQEGKEIFAFHFKGEIQMQAALRVRGKGENLGHLFPPVQIEVPVVQGLHLHLRARQERGLLPQGTDGDSAGFPGRNNPGIHVVIVQIVAHGNASYNPRRKEPRHIVSLYYTEKERQKQSQDL